MMRITAGALWLALMSVITPARADDTQNFLECSGWSDSSRSKYFDPSDSTIEACRHLAVSGDIDAQNTLGLIYFMKGFSDDTHRSQSYSESVKWYRLAADQGNAHAEFVLGMMYTAGEGVQKSDAEAAKWRRKSADQGDIRAQYQLGIMYAEGKGVSQDYVQAYLWFSLAAVNRENIPDSNFSELAFKIRDHIEQKMTAEQIAEAQKLTGEWKPTLH